MQLDNETLLILKNYAKINPSIIFDKGSVIKTISPTQTIMSKSTVKVEFPRKFALTNLDTFIGILSAFNNPYVEFQDSYLIVKEDTNKSTKMFYASEDLITKAPNKVNLPSVDVTFELKYDDFAKVEKMAGILGLPEICIVGDGETISLRAENSKNPTSDSFSIDVGSTKDEFKAIFARENLQILKRDYTVDLCFKGISHFKSDDVEYWITIEENSKF